MLFGASNDLPITMQEDSLPHYCSKCDERYGDDLVKEQMERDHESHEEYLQALKRQQESWWLGCLRGLFNPELLFTVGTIWLLIWLAAQLTPLKQL